MQYKLRYTDAIKRRLIQQADFMRRCDEIVERAREMNEHIAEHLEQSGTVHHRKAASNRANTGQHVNH